MAWGRGMSVVRCGGESKGVSGSADTRRFNKRGQSVICATSRGVHHCRGIGGDQLQSHGRSTGTVCTAEKEEVGEEARATGYNINTPNAGYV